VQRAITSVLRENHFHDMLQAAYDRGVKQASKKEAIKRGKPLTGLRARTSIPKPPTTDKKEALRKAWEERGVK